VADVYYSVGQNSSDHKTGSPTITIVSGVATFSVAQIADNLVAGDRVTYNSSTQICYLKSKISPTSWNVITALGAAAADRTAIAVDSIAHEYTSLSAAEAGASDANHLNTSNLATGNYILHIVCCYDSASDTTAFTVDGWTMSATYYLEIIAPNNSQSDCNVRQRHQGIWSATKFNITVSNAAAIQIKDTHVRVIGLQIKVSTTNAGDQCGIYVNTYTGDSDIRISHCIMAGHAASAQSYHCGIETDAINTGTQKCKIWNCLFYDFGGAAVNRGYGIFQATTASNLYTYINNCTAADCGNGYHGNWNDSDRFIIKNSIASGIGNTGYDGHVEGSNYDTSNKADTTGANSKNSVTPTYKDIASDNYHLAYNDTVARASGTDLSGDANAPVVDDFEGANRTGLTYDIGADQFGIEPLRRRMENY
jgi:hypothetical protein